jgi:hypothetical protein
MNFLTALNGNYFINRTSLSLEQVDKIEAIKKNKLFKLNLIALRKTKLKYNFVTLYKDNVLGIN